MKRLSIILTITAAAAVCALAPSIALAHHTTVACADRATSSWSIQNSESDKPMTFTTDAGHTGSIGKGGSTTVTHSGTSLTVYGTWSNGTTNTSSGQGNCVPATTTTTTTTTTTLPPVVDATCVGICGPATVPTTTTAPVDAVAPVAVSPGPPPPMLPATGFGDFELALTCAGTMLLAVGSCLLVAVRRPCRQGSDG